MKQEMIACPRCRRPAWKPDRVARIGKNPGRQYWYLRYRHPKDGRTKRNKTCYLPISEAQPVGN